MTLAAGARGLTLALLVLLAPAAALAQPKFPALTGRVVDQANLISPPTEAQLTERLAALEAQTGRQVVVATVPDLQGYEIEEYGYQLGRTWAIGRKGEDDGAILLVAPNERKVRVEVGYGLEPVLTDALSSVILQSRVLPLFREGRFEAGIVAGTDAIIQQLALPEDQARAQVAQAEQAQAARRSDGGGSPIPVIFIIFIVFWVLSGVLGGFGRRRRRRRGFGIWPVPIILPGPGWGGGRGGWGGGGFGGGGFSGGGGSFGGGGASGSW